MFDSSRNGAAVSLAPQPNGAAATSKLMSRTNGSVPEELNRPGFPGDSNS
jgi:hypothetical protein